MDEVLIQGNLVKIQETKVKRVVKLNEYIDHLKSSLLIETPILTTRCIKYIQKENYRVLVFQYPPKVDQKIVR